MSTSSEKLTLGSIDDPPGLDIRWFINRIRHLEFHHGYSFPSHLLAKCAAQPLSLRLVSVVDVQRPMARISSSIYSDAFTTVRREAKILVSPIVHGMYLRPLLGPSFQWE